jgi:uncharacterized protein (DUF927 family)
MGASVWGEPDDRSPESLIHSWDGTRVFMERAPAVLNGLPVFLDDSSRARKDADVAITLYNIQNGRGRGRGSIDGLRATSAWKTVLVSSGEMAAVSRTEDGGTRARVLSFYGSPFGGTGQATRDVVVRLNTAVMNNHGHAGVRFIRYLLAEWNPKVWLRLYQRKVSQLLETAGDNPIAGRLAGYVATVHVAGVLAHRALELPGGPGDAIAEAWKHVLGEVGDADVAVRALEHMASWVTSNIQAFAGRHREDKEGQPILPPSGWAGRWDEGTGWTHVYVLPAVLKKVLKEAGYSPDSVLHTWKERGWIQKDSEGKSTVPVHCALINGGGKMRVVSICRAALEHIADAGDDQVKVDV